ncbi:MAG TPA: molybdopterin cofactor-binding domain-containing protein, partial [Actinomycetota bacterium]|nr:molybdopterin cofactor-binding domain-containing protein [Actinomycetota bacterium]
MAITEKFVGQSLPRKEDASLLTGQGSFVDNLTLPGMLYLAVVRSPFAHARIVKVDVSKAREMPGVVGAWSGEELAGEWAGPLPMVWPITEDIKISDHWPITKDKARFQGDGVAVVVAESRGIADDAAEVVAVEYEQLTPVLDLEEGAKDGSPLVHDELGTNAVVHWSHGGGGDQGVFDNAPVQLRLRYEAPRITPSPIEPRGALASVVPAMGEFTLWTSTQIPHIARVTLSGTTGIPEHKLRIVAPDVGGAFGAKLNVYAEEALCLALARRTGRA